MSLEERERYQNQKLQEFVGWAYDRAPAWKQRLDGLGVKPSHIRTIKDLEKIPIIRKDHIVELEEAAPPFGGLLAVPLENVERVAVAPGPLYLPVHPPDWFFMPKMLYTAGLRKGAKVLATFSYMYMASWGIDIAVRALGGMTIPTGTGNTELQVRIIHDVGVTAYCGTPSFLMILVKKAEELGYDFRRDFALRQGVVTAERMAPSLRKALEEYGLRVYDFYGTAEGHLAYECEARTGYHYPEEMIWEIVDPATGKQLGPGETGEMVGTSLAHRAFPLIRFGTGDLSYYTEELCPCGRTYPRLAGVMGRVEDVAKVRGAWLVPRQVEEVVSGIGEIARYQVVVSQRDFRDRMVFRLELAGEGVDRDKVSDALSRGIQDICRLKVDGIEFVDRGDIPEGAKAIVDERTWE
jgi:phenylacetate-CoA ligase